MNTLKYLAIITLSVLLFTSCADVTIIDDCVLVDPYGFWSGLWHGAISVFSFVGGWFSDDIAIYAVNNNGGWYDFGFILGIGSLGGGGSKIAS